MTIQIDDRGNYARHGNDRLTIEGNAGVDVIAFTGAVLTKHQTPTTAWFVKITTSAGTVKDAARYEDGVVRYTLGRNGIYVEGDARIQLQAEYDGGKTWQTVEIDCTIGSTIPADQMAEEEQLPYLQEVDAKLAAITGMTAQAETLPPGSDATAAWDGDKGVLTIGVPRGADGAGGAGGDAKPQEAVLYTPQELTREQMAVARANIGAAAANDRGEIYTSMAQIAEFIRKGDVATNLKRFPIGDQIIVSWKDMNDGAHNTDDTAYRVPLDIVHHGEVMLESGEVVPGMYLQWHHCSPYDVQFSHQQAFLNCPGGLAAGTYYVTLASNWGSNAVANANWSFTLTKAVPAGGRLSGFEGMPDQVTSNWRVKSWSTPADANPLETVSVTSGATGTHLGLMPYAKPDEATGLNCMQRVAYGHDRWDTSALRQYLNASGTGWWVSRENYDIRPDQYANRAFMSGFNDDFLSAIKPVRVTTALNTVEGYTGTTVDTFDRFFLPSLEQMNVVPQLAGAEGEYWAYWRRRLGVSAPVAQYGTYPNLITTAINAKTLPKNIRFRSAYRDYSCYPWVIYDSGNVSSFGGASYANRFCPVCVVC